jgi:hypothetical protein
MARMSDDARAPEPSAEAGAPGADAIGIARWTTPSTREWRADAAYPRTLGLGTLRWNLRRPGVAVPFVVIVGLFLILAVLGALSRSVALVTIGLVVAILFALVLPVATLSSIRRLRTMIPIGARFELGFERRALRVLSPFGRDEIAYSAVSEVRADHGLGLVRLRSSGRWRPIPLPLLDDGALDRLRAAVAAGEDPAAPPPSVG